MTHPRVSQVEGERPRGTQDPLLTPLNSDVRYQLGTRPTISSSFPHVCVCVCVCVCVLKLHESRLLRSHKNSSDKPDTFLQGNRNISFFHLHKLHNERKMCPRTSALFSLSHAARCMKEFVLVSENFVNRTGPSGCFSLISFRFTHGHDRTDALL